MTYQAKGLKNSQAKTQTFPVILKKLIHAMNSFYSESPKGNGTHLYKN
jgi:hypothetical protein